MYFPDARQPWASANPRRRLRQRWVRAVPDRNKRPWLCGWILCCVSVCTCTRATEYELRADGAPVIGADGHIRSTYQDTLLELARIHSVGYEEIVRANPGVNVWLPGENTHILLPGRHILPPGPREGIVVNLPEHRLYYYPKPRAGERAVVLTYPVSIGSLDWRSPLGLTRIVTKEEHPVWVPTESIRKEHAARGDPLPRIVPAGPDNPLGDFKMRLATGGGTYEIHATNNPVAVGMAVTHGCITMYPEDLAALFPLVPVGTKVRLINEPVKVAYTHGGLLLEAHPPLNPEGSSARPDLELLAELVDGALGPHRAIHWDFAREVLRAATGMPTVIGLETNVARR